MDTTCAGITGITYIDITNDSIVDLTGIQYFDNLQYLTGEHNFLTNIPSLPANIINLDISNNQLTSLPALPNTLTNLYCNNNLLTSLPSLPNSIAQFYCQYNQLYSLPALPTSLYEMYCGNNNLMSLPTLPNGLYGFNCRNNQLTSLPALPNGLYGFGCDTNQLVSLPILPNAMRSLSCRQNQLTSLPRLPDSLTYINCSNNNISCFPAFPNSLMGMNFFFIQNNPFTCLPNYVPGMDAISLTYPLCVSGDLTNNLNGCDGASIISGYAFLDNNSTCYKDSLEPFYPNVHLLLYNSIGNLSSQSWTNYNGNYSIPEPPGTFTIKIDTTEMPYSVQCSYPGIDSIVTVTTADPLQSNINFPITCKLGFDVGVQYVNHSSWVFPGEQHILYFDAGDMSNWYNLHCAAGISGQVVVTITGPVTYYGIPPGRLIPSIAGNVFTYTIPDFGTLNGSTAFGIELTTDTSAVSGDPICVHIIVTPDNGDNNINNNTINYCYPVWNSHDPNYKETYPESVPVGFDDSFTYTIHFQNTGSAAAINIHLQDTLDGNLDLNTFQLINYSHYNTTWLNGNKLSFNFPNIQLPDSTSDFDGSQGFVQYRIKPLAGLGAGTLIHNRASIYFDYNAPVVTNTSVNEFMGTVSNGELRIDNGELVISPNPTTGKFQISDYRFQIRSVKVTDVVGKEVICHWSLVNGKEVMIDMSGYSKGIYFVRVELLDVSTSSPTNVVNRKIIIQ